MYKLLALSVVWGKFTLAAASAAGLVKPGLVAQRGAGWSGPLCGLVGPGVAAVGLVRPSVTGEGFGAAAENRTVVSDHLSGCVSATHRPWMDEMSSLFAVRFV